MDYRDAIDRMFDPCEQEEKECPICGNPQDHERPCSKACEETNLM